MVGGVCLFYAGSSMRNIKKVNLKEDGQLNSCQFVRMYLKVDNK